MKLRYCLIGLFMLVGCKTGHLEGKHVFYLHGMIIETQGIHAVSEEFGPYEYEEILDSLIDTGAMVHSEVRTNATDFDAFCNKVSRQIDSLVQTGTHPGDITVIGASRGGLRAMNISHLNRHPVNYILLGAASPYSETTFNFPLHGRILGIYEASDEVAPNNYDHWRNSSPQAEQFDQLQLNTGLGHGFIYRPIKEWLEPAKKVILQGREP